LSALGQFRRTAARTDELDLVLTAVEIARDFAGTIVTMAAVSVTSRRSAGGTGGHGIQDLGIRAVQTGEGWRALRKMTDIGVETF
jgi:hypothetical protein